MLTRILWFFKQKTAYEMRISDWSSDVCSSDLQYLRWHRWRAQRSSLHQSGIWVETEDRHPPRPPHWRRWRLRSNRPPHHSSKQGAARSEERRVGKECVSPCRSRLSPSH